MPSNRILIIDENENTHEDFRRVLAWDETSSIEGLTNGLFQQTHTSNDIKLPRLHIDSAVQREDGIQRVKESIAQGNPYVLTFVDLRMPSDMDGIQTIKKIWSLDPNIQTVICTVHSDYSWEDILTSLGNSDRLLILKKPFDAVEIRLTTLVLIKKWQLNAQVQLKLNELNNAILTQNEELANALSLTKTTLQATTDGVLVINQNKEVSFFNKQFANLWVVPKPILDQKNAEKIVAFMEEQTKGYVRFPIDTQTIINENLFDKVEELHLASGKSLERIIQPQYVESDIVGVVYTFRDVTYRKALEVQLSLQATHDFLTGLPNRILLVDRIQQSILHAKRDNSIIAVLFIDLDTFKLVNDNFGHDIGDELLEAFSQRLKLVIRETYVVGRLGGNETLARLGDDEFVVVLPLDTLDKAKLELFINRIYTALVQPYQLKHNNLIVNCGIGISLFPQDGEDPITLIKNADNAMHHVKEKKTGVYAFYEKQMFEQSTYQFQLVQDLHYALERNELFIDYQPVIDLKTMRIISLEALIRWQHPTQGLIPPAVFVPIAESTGQIIQIGTWTLRTACEQNKQWQNSGIKAISIAVNVSAHQLKQKDFVEIVKNILKETNLDPKFLELELTENIILGDVRDVTKKMQTLRSLGVKFNIDDFGTGYSSLSYLKQFPIDKIKIDQSFVNNVDTFENRTIIKSILMLARGLKMDVIAEGVETKEQLNIMRAFLSTAVQGFYLGRPTPANEVPALLLSNAVVKKENDKKQ